jgi:arylsulfatase A-like enzyme/tetratricopeptide (TPR) repeat protein
MRRPWLLAAAGLAVAIAVLWLWWRSGGSYTGATGEAGLLLITVDGLRCDRTGACAGPGGLTPSLDRLASRGVSFERAITAAVASAPSHATLLTGQWPFTHGVRAASGDRLGPGAISLAGLLLGKGVKTWAVVSSDDLSGLTGLDQGFEIYDDQPAGRNRPARAVTEAALERMRQLPAGRFFLWVQYTDPALPVVAPEPFRTQHASRPYDGILAHVDAEIGRLLDQLEASGRSSRTLVVVAGSHGHSLGAHDEMLFGSTLHDEAVRVPLIVSLPPHVPSGVRVPAVVRTVDVLPTVADLLRLGPFTHASPGVTLWPWMAGRPPREGLAAYAEAMEGRDHAWSAAAGLRDDSFLFVESPRAELYDMAADPGQMTNLAGARADVASGFRARLEAVRSDDPLKGPGLPGTDRKDAGEHVRLVHRVRMALGAGQFDVAARDATSVLADHPADLGMRAFLAEALAATGDAAGAAAAWQAVVAARPDHRAARAGLVDALLRSGRLPEAEAVAGQGRDRDPDEPRWKTALARAALARGDGREGARLLTAALRNRPDHLPAIRTMALLLESSGKLEEAAAFHARAVEVAPHDPEGLMSWSWVLFRQQKYDEALGLLQRADEKAPGSPVVLSALGDVHRAMGKGSEAREAYGKALAADPRAAQALYGTGLIELMEGNAPRAVDLLGRAIELRPAQAAWREDLARALAADGRFAAAADQMDLFLVSGRAPADRREALVRDAEAWRRRGR